VSRNYLGNILNYSNRHQQLLTHKLKSVTSSFTRPRFNANPFHRKILRKRRREIGRQSLRYLLHLSEGGFYKVDAHKGNIPEGGRNISTLTCLTATRKSALSSSQSFDTDSGPVGIDNRCSVCMSHVKSDFVGELVESALDVTRFHGTKRCQVYRGTIKWCIADGNGVVHNILIPGSYYVLSGKHRLISGKHRLISPQHWAQSVNVPPDIRSASYLTLHDRVMLTWDNGRAVKTVPIDSQNVFIFDLAPGYQSFSANCLQAKYDLVVNDQNPETIPYSLDMSQEAKSMQHCLASDFLPDVLELEQLPSPSSFQLSGPASLDNCGV
jgi:hypothetical protein